MRVCYRTVQPHRFICIGLRCIDSHRRREQVCLFSSVFHSVRVFRPITINCFQECWVHRRAQCLLPSSMREGPRRNARICKARNLINSRAFPWAPAHLHGKNTWTPSHLIAPPLNYSLRRRSKMEGAHNGLSLRKNLQCNCFKIGSMCRGFSAVKSHSEPLLLNCYHFFDLHRYQAITSKSRPLHTFFFFILWSDHIWDCRVPLMCDENMSAKKQTSISLAYEVRHDANPEQRSETRALFLAGYDLWNKEVIRRDVWALSGWDMRRFPNFQKFDQNFANVEKWRKIVTRMWSVILNCRSGRRNTVICK